MRVKVWNDNSYAYKEQYRDQEIMIPAKSYIQMEEDDAVMFKGSFSPIIRDGDGQPLPQSFKKIRLEYPSTTAEVVVNSELQHLCNACRYLGRDAKDLEKHCQQLHSELVVKDEEAEVEIKTRKSKAS